MIFIVVPEDISEAEASVLLVDLLSPLRRHTLSSNPTISGKHAIVT